MRTLPPRILLLLTLLLAGRLSAQDYKFNRLGSEEGLSQLVINCIFQDNKGFMWFGTQDGLNRYDGYTMTVFKRDPEDANSLSNNFVYTIYQDAGGIIWIGTNGGGLDAFDPSTEKFTHYRNDPNVMTTLSNDVVRVIRGDNKGKLWIGTDEGLNEFDPATGKFRRFLNNPNDPYSISGDVIYDILEDDAGNMWAGVYGAGLSRYDRASMRFYNYGLSDEDFTRLYPPALTDDINRRTQCMQVRSLLLADAGHIWVATNGGGVQIFNIASHAFESVIYPDGSVSTISSPKVVSMCDDKRGNTWLGVYESSLDVYNRNDKTIQHYTPNEQDEYALRSAAIKCMYRDNNGNMWIGTNGDGLNVYFTSTSTIGHIRRSERPGVGTNTLYSSEIMSIMEDRAGLLWIGTAGGGLSTLDRETGRYTHYPQLSTASNNSVLSLLQSSDGTIWVGTYGEGLNSYDTSGKIKSWTPDNQLMEGTVLCIAEEPGSGHIWFGTFGAGLYRLDPETDSLTRFTAESNGLSSDYIYCLYFDRKGDLWIGTRAGGVMQRDRQSGKFRAYSHDDKNKKSLSNNIVYSFAEDQAGNLWMSTANGLNRFDRNTQSFDIWYERDGLASDNIYAILPDGNGNLWLSHNKGLTRFNIATKDGNPFRNYGPGAGVQPSEFNQGAYFRNRNGELFFGGQEGLNIINTKQVEMHAPPPPVYVISYKRFGKEVKLDSTIVSKRHINVTWRDNNFTFELAALDFVDPDQNLYQYMLEGIDDEWSPVTTNRYVSYTNLAGGHYRLHVRVADSNGNWSGDNVLLYIDVQPPFWRTNLFYALCVVFLVAGIFGFIRFRTASIRKEKNVLEAKVAERTQELAQKNADITSSIQYAKRIQSAILPDLDAIFEHLPQSFVLYRPKDIVSGDFYWFAERNGKCIIAVGDCTGHGVPGALMSMIGHNLLNQIVLEKGVIEPDEILNRLNDGVRAALKQDYHEQDTTDGMDIAVCAIDKTKHEVLYAGALRPLIVMHKGLMSKVESDRFPIGGSQDTRDRKFTLHRFPVDPGDTLYMFSDGYADQFGGEKGKKFMMKNLLQKLVAISGLSMPEQARQLEETFEQWKGDYQQVDDVLFVGIRIA